MNSLSSYLMTHLSESRIENIQRTVVLGRAHIIDVILHLHLDTISLVVLATLELLIAVLLVQSLQRPFLQRLPVMLHTLDDNRLVRSFEPVDKLLAVDVTDPDALHIIGKMLELVESIRIMVRRPGSLVAQFFI